jgi:ubiquinol-cytochrome c reductase cytochrome b subunit
VNFLKNLYAAFDDRTGLSDTIRPIVKHLVPPGTGWWYVFGSATLFAFIIQVVTGIALATMYIPSTEHAYQTIQFITQDATLGRLLRGIHFFGASAMVVLIGIHMVRVFLTAAYKFPREVNWLSGVILLALTLGMAFTGQLLRWDQNAFWSVIVGAEQAGRAPLIGKYLAQFIIAGNTVGGATLTRFFAFHVFFIPAVIFGLVGFHLYLVLRNGISEPPKPGEVVEPKTYRTRYQDLLKRKGVPFWPDVAWRDAVFGALVVFAVVALGLIFGPPAIGKPPDPTIIQANPRPDWYLLWYFALLALIPPWAENYVIIGAPLIGGLALFLLPFISNRGERSPLRRPWSIGIVLGVVLMVGTLLIIGNESPWSPDFNAKPLTSSVIGASSRPLYDGAQLFYQKGCQYCHAIAGDGGKRGPDLTTVGSRLTKDEMTIRILNGGVNMPAFANNITPDELAKILAFLQSRKAP